MTLSDPSRGPKWSFGGSEMAKSGHLGVQKGVFLGVRGGSEGGPRGVRGPFGGFQQKILKNRALFVQSWTGPGPVRGRSEGHFWPKMSKNGPKCPKIEFLDIFMCKPLVFCKN